jgi:hypothetical protein
VSGSSSPAATRRRAKGTRIDHIGWQHANPRRRRPS